MNMQGSWAIVTEQGEVDAVVHTREGAMAHRRMLRKDCDLKSRAIGFIGGDHGAACDMVDDRLREGKPVGRKAMETFRAACGCDAAEII